ncbi:MAG: hypothetical protein KBF82_05275 [Chitinophagaceae bacterium]|nr:hypothetical protein [Chitinophagaceae bacterium]MBP9103255.1 hypothetical protein [Chitinophagaceae bacterium]
MANLRQSNALKKRKATRFTNGILLQLVLIPAKLIMQADNKFYIISLPL